MIALIRRHPLLSFVVLAYALSWAYWIPLAVRGVIVTPGGTTTHFPGLLGPMIAAFVVTACTDGGRGLQRLASRMVLATSPPARFWMYALSPIAFLALAYVVLLATRAPLPRPSAFAEYSGLPAMPLTHVMLLALVFNGFGEETGWRGFALPRLEHKFGAIGGPLVLALIWAGWHVPSFWSIEGYRAMGVAGLLGGFGLGICAGSLVLARVVRRTGGSILAAAAWHALYNMTSATSAARGMIGAITTTCVMVWATVIVVQALRRRRARIAIA